MRGPGFEPGLTPRKGVVLPLDYPRYAVILPTGLKNIFESMSDIFK